MNIKILAKTAILAACLTMMAGCGSSHDNDTPDTPDVPTPAAQRQWTATDNRQLWHVDWSADVARPQWTAPDPRKYDSWMLVMVRVQDDLMPYVSSDDIDEAVDNTANQGQPLLIEVSETTLTDPEASGANSGMAGAFKAPIVTKTSLSQFYLNGYWSQSGKINPSYVSQTDNNKWVANNTWPSGISDDTDVHFYAYANVDGNPSSTPFYYGDYSGGYSPFLYFIVDENAEQQKDLLVAHQTAKSKNKTVHFHFTHPCAALQFAICKTKALTNFSIQVDRIILHNIYSRGYYHFNTDSWDVDTDEFPSNFTLLAYQNNTPGIDVKTEVSSTDRTNSIFLGNGEDDYMFFIPQTIKGWSGGSVADTDGAYIEIRCSIIKGNKNYAEGGAVYVPFSAVLEKGFIHRFNIRMGTSLRNADGSTINFKD